MGFELVGYSDLRGRLIAAVTELAGRKTTQDPKEFVNAYLEVEGTPDAAKLKEKFSNISDVRLTQVGLFLTFIRLLDADKSMEETQKTQVLNAIALHVRDLIELSYSRDKNWANWAASYFTDPNSSKLYCDLRYVLKIDLKNTPTPIEKQNFGEVLRDFMMKSIYVNGKDASKGYKPEFKDFSETRIFEFDVFKFLAKLNEKITAIRNGILKRDKAASDKAAKPASSGLSVFKASVELDVPCAIAARAKEDNFKSAEAPAVTA